MSGKEEKKNKTDVCEQRAACLFICGRLGLVNWPTHRAVKASELELSRLKLETLQLMGNPCHVFLCVYVCPFLCIAKGRGKTCAKVPHTEICFS